jgi:hypothetical protein
LDPLKESLAFSEAEVETFLIHRKPIEILIEGNDVVLGVMVVGINFFRKILPLREIGFCT